MKRILVIIVLAAGLFSLSSCSNKALEFNNKMVEIQSKLTPMFTEYGKKMENIGDKPLSTIVPDAKALMTNVDKSISDINALEAPADGANFKKSMLAQLEYLKKFCSNTIKMADEKLPDEEKITLASEVMNAGNELEKLESATEQAQKDFAKKNNFKLQSKN